LLRIMRASREDMAKICRSPATQSPGSVRSSTMSPAMPAPSLSKNTPPTLPLDRARRMFLSHHGLLAPPWPRPKTTREHVQALGFVQVDSVCTVMRAHDMILLSRHAPYRPNQLGKLVAKTREAFEHWTHDASVLPIEAYPFWRHKMARDAARLETAWGKDRRGDFQAELDTVLAHVSQAGPSTTKDVGQDEPRSSGGWWDWHPSKTALEYLWRRGDLAITARTGFRKVYDLAERVIPDAVRNTQPSLSETLDWSAKTALRNLGFATSGEIAAFHDLMTAAEAKTWVAEASDRGDIIPIEVTCAGGETRSSWALPDVLATAQDSPTQPGGRLRILSPFDPALRDRKRALRLFNFDYRIEIFTPAAKRVYGYYVFPVLDGDRIVGRIDMRVNRDRDCLEVLGYWEEARCAAGRGRVERLCREIGRYAVHTSMPRIDLVTGPNTECLRQHWTL